MRSVYDFYLNGNLEASTTSRSLAEAEDKVVRMMARFSPFTHNDLVEKLTKVEVRNNNQIPDRVIPHG